MCFATALDDKSSGRSYARANIRVSDSIMPAKRLAYLVLLMPFLASSASASQTTSEGEHLSAWTAVTVGVADLDEALALWSDQLGFSLLGSAQGDDAALAELWGLDPDDIARQAIVRTNDSRHGMIHFVQFHDPYPPVRQGCGCL